MSDLPVDAPSLRKRKRFRWIRALSVAIALVLFVYMCFALPPFLKIGLSNYQALDGGNRVTAVRVHSPSLDDIQTAAQRDEPIPATTRTTGGALTPPQVRRLRALLTRPGNEPPLFLGAAIGRKRCLFHPDIDFVVQSPDGSEIIVVTLCFSCDMWRVQRGKEMREGDFDSAEQGLYQLVMELFPDDQTIPKPAG